MTGYVARLARRVRWRPAKRWVSDTTGANNGFDPFVLVAHGSINAGRGPIAVRSSVGDGGEKSVLTTALSDDKRST